VHEKRIEQRTTRAA